jgi:DNA-binding transcriptional MerR regulator
MPQARYFELAEARRDGFHNIGEAAEATGVSAKMIRHYEEIGLVPKAGRTAAGYRIYRDADVKRMAEKHMADLDARIAELQGMRRTLEHLVHCCHGDDRPDCPILDDLAGA